jgi:hypothetical protein
VHLEALYVQKGAEFAGYTKLEFAGRDVPWTSTMKLDYLEMPVFLRVIQPLDVRYIANQDDLTTKENLWDRVADDDLGGILGAGREWRLQDCRVLLEVRYAPGILAIQANDDTIKNTSLNLTPGMAL